MVEAAGPPSMVIDKFAKYKKRQVLENHIRIFGDLSFLLGGILFKSREGLIDFQPNSFSCNSAVDFCIKRPSL